MHKVIMVTGSRKFSDYGEVARGIGIAIKNLVDAGAKDITVRHGACAGADSMVVEFVNKIERSLHQRDIHVKLEAYPPNLKKYGSPAAYHIRNKQMISDGADVCVAFLKRTEPNKGTLGVIKLAQAANIPVEIYGLQELDTAR